MCVRAVSSSSQWSATGGTLTGRTDFLSEFDVESSHSIRIAAPAHIVYDLARDLKLSESPVVRVLFALRSLPSLGFKGKIVPSIGFKVLREEPCREFVLGVIGQFWTLSGGLVDLDSHDFHTFDTPGYAKGTWSFHVREDADTTHLTTVTRVLCLGSASKRRFRRYWKLIGPFSGLIRREALRICKAKAEARAVHPTGE